MASEIADEGEYDLLIRWLSFCDPAVLIGIVILLIAKIYVAQLILLDFTDDDYAERTEEIQYNYSIMMALGTALIPMGLVIGALVLEDLGSHLRSGLAIAAGIMLGLTSFFAVL